MKKPILLLLPLVVFLFGCASEVMKGLVGKDITAVYAQYGPPVSQFDVPDGRRAFQWRMESAIVMPTTTTADIYGYGNYATGTATTTGGYLGDQVCFYTLYGQKNASKSYTVVGFEPPNIACE